MTRKYHFDEILFAGCLGSYFLMQPVTKKVAKLLHLRVSVVMGVTLGNAGWAAALNKKHPNIN